MIVAKPGWEQKLKDNQQQFAAKWANRPEFKAIFDGLSNDAFVNLLYANAGIVPVHAEKVALVAKLDAAAETRAGVLLEVAAKVFRQQEQSSAFVLMQYRIPPARSRCCARLRLQRLTFGEQVELVWWRLSKR